MAEQNLYLQALDNLELYSDKIREMFLERAGEDGIVDMHKIGDLMNDLNSIIGIDLGKAKKFFSKDNDNIPKSFNLDATTFEDFIELMRIWIQRKAGKRGKREEQHAESPNVGSLEDIPTVESRLNSNRATAGKKKRKGVEGVESEDTTERKKTMSRNIIVPPKNYKKNRERLDELLLKHREEFHNRFYERQDEATEKISPIDFLMFLQDCLSMDNLLLKERISDEQDFFQSDSSYQTLIKITESYFLNVRGVDADEFEIKNVTLTFNECFDIIDHWFQIDDNVGLLYENERQQTTQSNGGHSEVKKVLLDTIAKYKVMIEEANTEVERQVLQGTIDTLYQKLSELEGDNEENRGRIQNKNNKRREDKKIKALKEIFEFYAKQQLNGVKPVTFANLEKQFRTISIGKFSVILKNFKMKIDNFKLKEMFKKVAVSDDLNFEEFYTLLQRICKDAELITETKQYKPNPEIMKEYRPDCYKKSGPPKEPAKGELSKRSDLNSRKTEAERLEDMYEHMGLYDGSYRSNMQQVQLAFNTQEKESFRIDPESIKNRPKKFGSEDKTSEEIKEDIAKRNRLREVMKDVKREEKAVLNNYKSIPKQEPYYIVPKYDSYAQQAKKEKVVPIMEKKLTLKEVGSSKYSEMKDRGFDPKFNPHDLIEENDEEDNYYLAEYNLTLAKPQLQSHIVPQGQRDDLDQYKANDLIPKIKGGKRQSMAVEGRYSRMYESKVSRGGTVSPHHSTTTTTKSRVKPATSDENLEYSKNLPSMTGLTSNPNRSVVNITQSVKHLVNNASNPNLRNFGHVYESQYDPNNRGPQPMVARPEKINSNDHIKKPLSHVLDRVSKIQQDSKKREYEIMNNLINIQNNKLEQGLRVVRK